MKKIIAAAACFVAAASSHAQTADVFKVGASVTGLSYQVVDLKPNDGRPASFTLNYGTTDMLLSNSPNSAGYGVTDPPMTPVSVYGSLFDTSSGSVALPSGLAWGSKAGNSLSSNTQIDRSDLDNLGYDFFTAYRNIAYTSRYVGNIEQSTSSWYLAPQTQVTITGRVQLSVQVDGQSLVDHWDLLANQNRSLVLDASAGFFINASDFSVFNPNTGFYDPYPSANVWDQNESKLYLAIYGRDQVSSAGVVDIGPNSNTLERTFSITIKNPTNYKMLANLNSRVDTNAQWVAKVANVPEPGTWAMMGLGLGLMAWRVRATRTRATA